MAESVFLVHGWSVAETSTYQALHLKLAKDDFELKQIFLGRYVSLDDHVEIKDLAAAMHKALIGELGKTSWNKRFHIVTHSTGALITKEWILKHYTGRFAKQKALGNVVFLAGPHFGSRLAHHGRSMVAHIKFLGQTGNQILKALELGSSFSWENNFTWIDTRHWREKGIRPYCLIGDKTTGSIFAKKIFGAAFEKGSDMVVRVPAANLNFRRYRLNAQTDKLIYGGGISGIPFVVLDQYVHSGKEYGIMNSITRRADPDLEKYQNLRIILDCLKTKTNSRYRSLFETFRRITDSARKKPRKGKQYVSRPFAQIDFFFRDHTGAPVEDYSFTLGCIKKGRQIPSKTIAHIHKNKVDPSHLTVFIDLVKFEPDLKYFMKLESDSGTHHFKYVHKRIIGNMEGKALTDIIVADQTTQIEVVLGREPGSKLFVFHRGDDCSLHVKWNREGDVTKRGIKPA